MVLTALGCGCHGSSQVANVDAGPDQTSGRDQRAAPIEQGVSGDGSTVDPFAGAPKLLSIDVVVARAERLASAGDDYFSGLSLAGDARGHYRLDYALAGLLHLYEATGDARWIVRALGWAKNIVSTAQPKLCRSAATQERCKQKGYANPYDDAFLDWIADVQKVPVPLEDFKGTLSFARLARIIIGSPTLAKQHEADARALLAFVDKHVMTKWVVARADRWTGFIEGRPMEVKAAKVAQIAWDLYQGGIVEPRRGSQTWKDLALAIATSFRGMLEEQGPGTALNNHSMLWDIGKWDWWHENRASPSAPDVYHNNRLIKMVVQLYEEGVVFGKGQVAGLARTLNHNVWNGIWTFDEAEARQGSDGKSLWFAT